MGDWASNKTVLNCIRCLCFYSFSFVLYSSRRSATALPGKFQQRRSSRSTYLPHDCHDISHMTASSEICARAWKLTAQFCVDAYPRIYDPNEQIIRGKYVHGFLLARFQRMHDRMSSINCFSFVMPRVIRTDRIVTVIIILHGSHVLRQSTI